jgi:hypothetical protein
MSNYFPDGRPIQRMMHALSGEAVCKAISPTLTGSAIAALIANYSSTPANYPGYTLESFTKMLSQVNLVHINGGTYNFGGPTSIAAPAAGDGGIFISGAENFRKLKLATAATLVLYVKPTP